MSVVAEQKLERNKDPSRKLLFSQNPYYFRAEVKFISNHCSCASRPSFYTDVGHALNLFYSISVSLLPALFFSFGVAMICLIN